MPDRPLFRLAMALFAMNLALLAAYVTGTLLVVPNAQIYRLINLDGEASLGSWFSASQLFLTGTVFALAACSGKNESLNRAFLGACALAFLFLSADEAAAIHEKVTMLLRGVEFLPRFSGNHGIWIPMYMLAGAAFVAMTHRSWLQLWRAKSGGFTVFLVGVALFVFGAVALEIASYGILRDEAHRGYYVYQVLFEEAFELFGVSTILVGSIQMLLRKQLASFF